MRYLGVLLLLFFAADRSALAAGHGSQVTDYENPSPVGPLNSDTPGTARTPFLPDPAPADGGRSSQQQQSPKDSAAPQVLAGVLFSAVGLGLVGYFGRLDASGSGGWYSLAALGGWAVGTGAVVCALGRHNRHGGCKLSMLGALAGSLGSVPGILMLRQSLQPCTIQGPNADDKCVNQAVIGGLLGILLTSGGYIGGTTAGAMVGWNLGATKGAPLSTQTASVQFLTLTF